MIQRLKTEGQDLLLLVLLPGLAAILPWRLCFFIFKRLARLRWLYQEPCEAALSHARQLGWVGTNEAHWLWVRKLVTLVDHADHYLGLWRSDAWMQRHQKVNGHWPNPDHGLLLLTFHWGAGYWGLRHAAAHNLSPHALVATLTSQAYQGRTIMSWYARSRNANVARTLGAPTIDVATQLKQVIRALRDNHCLLGVMDVPADQAKASIEIQLLGMQARMPSGLLRLAVDQQVPVTVYTTGLDVENGQRYLNITPLGVHHTIDELAKAVFAELDQVIAQDAPAWHFWGIAERLFVNFRQKT
jgi:lauroyl/myristoyl acyltransferase